MFAIPDGGWQRQTRREDDDGGVDEERPQVLVADDPRRGEQYTTWLESLFSTRLSSDAASASAAMDGTLDVAILGAAIAEDTKQVLLERLDVRSPFARAVVIPDDDRPPMLEAPGYDACLFLPVERDQLLEVVKRMARLSTYERTVSTYFQLTTQAAAFEYGGDEVDVRAERREAIQSEIDRLGERLEHMRSALDDADREALLESIGDDAPATFAGEVHKSTAKRQPDECAECGLVWGIDQGGQLGQGCEHLGAFVWKCTNCGAVQQASDPAHQWVA